MLDTLFKNALVLTMCEKQPVGENLFVGIRAGRIAYLSALPPVEDARRHIDAMGQILMPGLVNTHAHIGMTLLRGYADDYTLHNWLKVISPAEHAMDDDAAYVSAKLGIAEMLSCGITSISDMDMHLAAVMRAADEMGINASVCNSAMCAPENEQHSLGKDVALREMQEALPYHMADDGRLRMDMGVHAEYTSTERLCREIAEFAAGHAMGIQLHLSETAEEHEACIRRHGLTPAAFFEKTGVFDCPTTAAHCVAISKEDRCILREKQVSVAHNPISNLKLASGIALVSEYLAEGISVSLGTDSACSNNSLDLFEELKLSALLQKGLCRNALQLDAYTALKLATVNGARAQGREGQTGSVQLGMYADLVLLRKDSYGLLPLYDPISAVVYAASARDVQMTMVRGAILYENGELTRVDGDALRAQVHHTINRIPLLKDCPKRMWS